MPNHKLNLFSEKATPYSSWHPVGNYSVEDIEKIVNPSADSEKKIFTAIPSPFASFHMYDMAFKLSRSDKFIQGNTSVYDKMVSDVLDLFEIVFYSSIDSDGKEFRIEPLDLPERLERKISGNGSPHKLLAETIQSYFSSSAFDKNNPRPFLLYWGNKLLGVTSPFTYFQPAFNLEVKVNSKNTGTHQHFYFDSKPLHIMERNKQFLKFFYEWVMFHRVNLSGSMSNFVEFFDRYRMRIETELHRSEFQVNNQIQDLSDYTKLITGNNQQVEVAGVPFYCQVKSSLLEKIKKSPMIIKPSKPQPQGVDLPIVLFDGWASDGKEDPKRRYSFNADIEDFEKRALPDQKIDYPCLYPSDFIEEDLLMVKYPINNRFLRLIDNNESYDVLLPLKPKFFDFFTLEDVNKLLKVVSLSENEIKIELSIPINKSGAFKWNRTYKTHFEDENKFIGRIHSYNFGMVFFPLIRHSDRRNNNFYKILFVDGEINEPNMYEDFNLEIYNPDNKKLSLMQKISDQRNKVYRKTTRKSKKSEKNTIGRYLYQIDTEFEYLRLNGLRNSRNEIPRGIIYPDWNKLVTYGNKKINAAIDFGTTNTHIELGVIDEKGQVNPLNYQPEDNLVVRFNALSKDTSSQIDIEKYKVGVSKQLKDINFAEIQNLFFMPSIVDSENSYYKFPIRTLMLKNIQEQNELDDIFDKINIAIAYFNEYLMGYTADEKLTSNLKWGIDANEESSKNVTFFFRQLLFLIKLKIISLGGDPQKSQIIYFYPTSLSKHSRDFFSKNWRAIFSEIFANSNFSPISITESQAPYYFHIKQNDIYENAVTALIDIGGGSSDISVFNNGRAVFGSSFYFAGNSIWGNTFVLSIIAYNDVFKGLTQMQKEIVIQMQTTLLQSFGKNNGFIEFFNFLFDIEKDANYFFSSHLDKNPKFRFIILYFFSAIIYHTLDIVSVSKESVPKFICLGGNGAKLLQRLDLNPRLENIREFINAFIRNYNNNDDFQVQLHINEKLKETTAKGGLIFSMETNKTYSELNAVFLVGDNDVLMSQKNSLNFDSYTNINDSFFERVIKFNRLFLKTLEKEQSLKDSFNINVSKELYSDDNKLLDKKFIYEKYNHGFQDMKNSIIGSSSEFNQTLFFLPIRESFEELCSYVYSE